MGIFSPQAIFTAFITSFIALHNPNLRHPLPLCQEKSENFSAEGEDEAVDVECNRMVLAGRSRLSGRAAGHNCSRQKFSFCF